MDFMNKFFTLAHPRRALALLAVVLLSACAGQTDGKSLSAADVAWDKLPPAQVQAPPAGEAPSSLYEYYANQSSQPGRPDTPGAMPAGALPGMPQPGSAQKVKVGLLLPLSGENKAIGEAMLNAAQMAVFDVGQGNFELVPLDTASSASGARAALQLAQQNKAQLILGPVFASEVRAISGQAQAAGLNVIAFSTDWSLAGGNTFVMGFMPFDQVERIGGFALRRNISQIGIIAPDTAYGRAVAGAYRNYALAQNMAEPVVQFFPAAAPDLAQAVESFLRSYPGGQRPGAVLIPATGAVAGTISDLLAQRGLPQTQVPRLGMGLWDDLALTGQPALDGAIFAAPAPQMRQSFEKRYFESFNAPPPRLATLAYDAAALAAVLAQRGEQSDGKPAFDRRNITNPNGFSGLDGIFRFRDNGLAERGLAVLQFQGRRMSVIDPAPKTFESAPAF